MPRPTDQPPHRQEEILLLIHLTANYRSSCAEYILLLSIDEEIAETAQHQEELREEEAVHPHHAEVNRLPHKECGSGAKVRDH